MTQRPFLQKLKRENAKLRALVYRDELTGFLNRRGFRELTEKLFQEIRWRMKHPEKRKSLHIESFTVLFLDIDHFKHLNDRYGHDAGDRALAHVARLIAERVRGIDVVARWGGEEIVVALLGADERHGAVIAEDIRRIVETHPLRFDGKRILLSVSIGVAGLSKETKLDHLVTKADHAMYRAKMRGRNRVVSARAA